MGNDLQIPSLSFPSMPIGTHSMPWDLFPLLYLGGAGINRRKGFGDIQQGKHGVPLLERVPLVSKLHDQISTMLESGSSINTVESHLENLFRFFRWVDARQNNTVTLATVRDLFCTWVEHLVYRYQVKKDLLHTSAYVSAVRVGTQIGLALGLTTSEPARALMRYTRMRRPARSRRVLGTQADKQRLSETFEFGAALRAVCEGLGPEAVRGPLPVPIDLPNGRKILLKGLLKNPALDPESMQTRADRERAIRLRAPLDAHANAIDERPTLINVRIEAELLIFVAQTGMNLSQAASLTRENYRWQSDGDDLNAFRVFKGRRHGEAIFRCFKVYREHMKQYFHWLDVMGLSDADERCFPFVYHTGKAPAAHSSPQFQTTRRLCEAAGLRFYGPRSLRKTRINWLLRRSRDPNLTAEQASHSKETLLTAYEQPHYQTTAAEIVRFHLATDPTLSPPGPGICADDERCPVKFEGAPLEAPEPDCISPDGCLFCIYHRDVMTAEYCWKLASHSRIKQMEVVLYRPPKSPSAPHPANAVVDRIESKLNCIAAGSDIRAAWVIDARDAIRSGSYHPDWEGHIQLMEAMNDIA